MKPICLVDGCTCEQCRARSTADAGRLAGYVESGISAASDSNAKEPPPKRSMFEQLERGYVMCVECRGLIATCKHCYGSGVVGR